MNRATVEIYRADCTETYTDWNPYSFAPIAYLDRHDIECPYGKVLARFRLRREGNYAKARVDYHYKCCKFAGSISW